MSNDYLYFLLSLSVHFEIFLRAPFGRSSLNVLPDHDDGQEDKLEDIAGEEPDDKSGSRIEAKLRGSKHVPSKPDYSPDKDKEEEA